MKFQRHSSMVEKMRMMLITKTTGVLDVAFEIQNQPQVSSVDKAMEFSSMMVSHLWFMKLPTLPTIITSPESFLGKSDVGSQMFLVHMPIWPVIEIGSRIGLTKSCVEWTSKVIHTFMESKTILRFGFVFCGLKGFSVWIDVCMCDLTIYLQ